MSPMEPTQQELAALERDRKETIESVRHRRYKALGRLTKRLGLKAPYRGMSGSMVAAWYILHNPVWQLYEELPLPSRVVQVFWDIAKQASDNPSDETINAIARIMDAVAIVTHRWAKGTLTEDERRKIASTARTLHNAFVRQRTSDEQWSYSLPRMTKVDRKEAVLALLDACERSRDKSPKDRASVAVMSVGDLFPELELPEADTRYYPRTDSRELALALAVQSITDEIESVERGHEALAVLALQEYGLSNEQAWNWVSKAVRRTSDR